MRRREYFAAAATTFVISTAGCSSEDPSQSDNSTPSVSGNPTTGSTDNTSEGSGDNTTSDPQTAVINAIDIGAEQIDSGDQVEVTVTVTIPVIDGLIEADITTTLERDDTDELSESLTSIAESANGESAEVSRDIQFETENLETGTYQLEVIVAGPDIETSTRSGPTVEIVDPYAESRTTVRKHISTAEDALNEAMSRFESHTGSGTTATGEDDFSEVDMLRDTRPAIEAIDEGREYDLNEIGLEERINELDEESAVVRMIARTQTDATDAFEECEMLFTVYTEENTRSSTVVYDDFEETLTEFRQRVRGASSDSLENLQSAVQQAETQREYSSIVAEYNAEVDAFEEYGPILDEHVSAGERELSDARDSLEDEDYPTAQAAAERAIDAYESAINELESIEPVAFEDLTEEHIETLETQIEEADKVRINAIEKESS